MQVGKCQDSWSFHLRIIRIIDFWSVNAVKESQPASVKKKLFKIVQAFAIRLCAFFLFDHISLQRRVHIYIFFL